MTDHTTDLTALLAGPAPDSVWSFGAALLALREAGLKAPDTWANAAPPMSPSVQRILLAWAAQVPAIPHDWLREVEGLAAMHDWLAERDAQPELRGVLAVAVQRARVAVLDHPHPARLLATPDDAAARAAGRPPWSWIALSRDADLAQAWLAGSLSADEASRFTERLRADAAALALVQRTLQEQVAELSHLRTRPHWTRVPADEPPLLHVQLPHRGGVLTVRRTPEGLLIQDPSGERTLRAETRSLIWEDPLLGRFEWRVRWLEPQAITHYREALWAVEAIQTPLTVADKVLCVSLAEDFLEGGELFARLHAAAGVPMPTHGDAFEGGWVSAGDAVLAAESVGRVLPFPLQPPEEEPADADEEHQAWVDLAVSIRRELQRIADGSDDLDLLNLLGGSDEALEGCGQAIRWLSDELARELRWDPVVDERAWWGLSRVIERDLTHARIADALRPTAHEANDEDDWGAWVPAAGHVLAAANARRASAARPPTRPVRFPTVLYALGGAARPGELLGIWVDPEPRPPGDVGPFDVAHGKLIAPSTLQAVRAGFDAARALTKTGTAPHPFERHRCEVLRRPGSEPVESAIDGRSIALASMLAFAAAWTRREPPADLVATGDLAWQADGWKVTPIVGIPEKVQMISAGLRPNAHLRLLVPAGQESEAVDAKVKLLPVADARAALERAQLADVLATVEGAACPADWEERLETLGDVVRDGLPADGNVQIARPPGSNAIPWVQVGTALEELVSAALRAESRLAGRERAAIFRGALWGALALTYSGAPGRADALLGLANEAYPNAVDLGASRGLLGSVIQLAVAIYAQDWTKAEAANGTCDRYLAHVQDEAREDLYGITLGTQGRYRLNRWRLSEIDRAVTLLDEAVEHHRTHAHDQVPRSLVYLAQAFRVQGRAEDALQRLDEAWTIADRELERDPVALATQRIFLHYERARCRINQARWSDARREAELALALARAHQPAPIPGILRALVWACRPLGDDDAAAAHLAELEALTERAPQNRYAQAMRVEAQAPPGAPHEQEVG